MNVDADVFTDAIGKLLDDARIDQMRTGGEKPAARGVVAEAGERRQIRGGQGRTGVERY